MTWLGYLVAIASTWCAVALVWPAGAARLIPSKVRASPTAGVWFVAALSVLFFAVGWATGSALGVPGDTQTSPVVLELAFAVLLGLPAAVLARRAWVAGLRLGADAHGLPWDLPPLSAAVLAVDVVVPTPTPTGPHLRPWEAHRTDRGLRRLVTLVLALLFALWILLRLMRVASLANNPATAGLPPAGEETMSPAVAACLLILVASGVVLLVARGIQIYRHHREGGALTVASAAALNDWRVSHYQGPDLVRAFASSPLPRVRFKGERIDQEVTVHARSGDRLWWATQQRAKLRKTKDAVPRTLVRSSWIVWLPGVNLPSMLVTGRDNTRVRDWFGPSIQLESETFNRRHYAYAHPGQQRQAVAVLHPRMMELLIAALPDGATALVQGDYVCVWRDGPMHGTDLCTHGSLALQIADLLPTFLLRDHLTEPARALIAQRDRPQRATAPLSQHDHGPAPSLAVPIRWLGARLYQSDAELTRRLPDGDDALLDYLQQLRSTAAELLAAAAAGRPIHLLISVGLRGGPQSGFWCDDLMGSLAVDDLASLTTALQAVPVTVDVIDPVAFTLTVAVNDPKTTHEEFPIVPSAWVTAAAEAGRPLAIPDELFDWMWPSPAHDTHVPPTNRASG